MKKSFVFLVSFIGLLQPQAFAMMSVRDLADLPDLHKIAQLPSRLNSFIESSIEEAVKNGTNLNEVDSLGQTALHYAVRCCNVHMVNMLTKQEAIKNNIDLEDKTKHTALFYALQALQKNNNIEEKRAIVDSLLDAGAILNNEWLGFVQDQTTKAHIIKKQASLHP
ncbi:MAG: ankyrin repeat domain-containing protein [Epsilonproteobacteria bacterium]|nr:ankyrin repeat domain-containing protein [Campylobacterota bacterium]